MATSSRVTQRQFLLLPSGEINTCIRYVVALAAAETGVRIHGICVLSNHYHIILSDPFGLVPQFQRLVNGLLARAINCYRGRWESLWSAGGNGLSYVQLEDAEAVIDKAVYTATNPVTAGLVSNGEDWPGVRHLQPGSISVNKPGFFFRALSGKSQSRKKRTKRDKGAKKPAWREYLEKRRSQDQLPEKASLQIHPLPIEGNTAEIQKKLANRIADAEKRVRIEFRKTGRNFLGVTAIRKQSPFDSPGSAEPRRGLSPKVATRDKWARIAALQRNKAFEELHEAARVAFYAGDRDVEFPAGTYAMRVRYNVNCAPEP